MFEKYSDRNPANRVLMTFGFAWRRPSHVIATFFGAGALRPAPGTWGTLAGVLVFALLNPAVEQAAAALSVSTAALWLSLAAALFFLGVWATGETARDMGVEDHGGMVVDEVAAVWLVCALVPASWPWWVGAFAAFRFFDIVKIWPGSWFDKHLHGGWGVMVDDVVAGLYAWLALLAVGRLIGA